MTLYVCMYVSMYECMYVCVCVYVCTYVRMYVCVCMYVCMHACMHACMYVGVRVRVRVCVCVYLIIWQSTVMQEVGITGASLIISPFILDKKIEGLQGGTHSTVGHPTLTSLMSDRWKRPPTNTSF